MQKTLFGWVIVGKTTNAYTENRSTTKYVTLKSLEDIKIKAFWEMETPSRDATLPK